MKKRLHAWIMKRWASVLTFKYRGSAIVKSGAWLMIVLEIRWRGSMGWMATGYNPKGFIITRPVLFRNNRFHIVLELEEP
jgi:hypothetical protein